MLAGEGDVVFDRNEARHEAQEIARTSPEV